MVAQGMQEYLLHRIRIHGEEKNSSADALTALSREPALQSPPYAHMSPTVRDALKDTISSMLERVLREDPKSPVQVHLGGNTYDSGQSPLSEAFIRSFADVLTTRQEQDKYPLPLCYLHIHGPLSDHHSLKPLFDSFLACPLLHHLHLDLAHEDADAAFGWLEHAIGRMNGIEEIVLDNNRGRDRLLAPDRWDDLATALSSHPTLSKISFIGCYPPPPSFASRLDGFAICPLSHSRHSFCIKRI
ncbi:MAG: hypothetical protein OXF02_00555 [Simkaniaceae bacterium]|nr:hypothetical protein [Simkaniaceae bacterium]